jgi:predicted short-subunit dehydrogenase-like oxidoreductase (DUF2520 family)
MDLVVARRGQSARRAAKLIGGPAAGLSRAELLADPARLNSSLIIISTPDDAIQQVASELAAVIRSGEWKPTQKPRVALHTSGALSSEILSPLRDAGFAAGSFHPLVSISDARKGATYLSGSFFALEGEAPAVRLARRMAGDLGSKSFVIPSGRKPLYHAAGLMASPNTTALFDIAVEMLTRCGIGRARARQILLPLTQSTLDNLKTHDPAQALTGTFKRGDIATVRKHLTAMKSEGLPDALAAYVLLGQRSLKLSGARNRDQIESLLGRVAKQTRKNH